MDFLKEILGEELYSQVTEKINAHNGNEANKDKQIKIANLATGDYISKAKHDALQAEHDSTKTELGTANGLIAELRKATKSNEEMQGKFTAYESEVANLKAQLEQTQIDAEIKIALLEAKAMDVDYLTFKLKEKGDKLERGEDGKIKGIDDILTGLKTQFPGQFQKANGGIEVDPLPLNQPNGNNSGVTPEQFAKMGYQSRLKLKQENPEAYATLTGKTN